MRTLLSFFTFLIVFLVISFSAQAASFFMDYPFEELTQEQFNQILSQQKDSLYPSQCVNAHLYSAAPQTGPIHTSNKARFILVDKSYRMLHLLDAQSNLMRSYRMALGKEPLGAKHMEGDNKTPEGLYFIHLKNNRSEFHLSLRINYPNPQDIAYAKEVGIANPGGDIMIHGLPNNPIIRRLTRHPKKDWTRGCIAVRDDEIEEIWEHTDLGIWVEICP